MTEGARPEPIRAYTLTCTACRRRLLVPLQLLPVGARPRIDSEWAVRDIKQHSKTHHGEDEMIASFYLMKQLRELAKENRLLFKTEPLRYFELTDEEKELLAHAFYVKNRALDTDYIDPRFPYKFFTGDGPLINEDGEINETE